MPRARSGKFQPDACRLRPPCQFTRTLGIYIQVPFCASKCSYGNFSLQAAQRAAVLDAYGQALEREIEELRAIYHSQGISGRLFSRLTACTAGRMKPRQRLMWGGWPAAKRQSPKRASSRPTGKSKNYSFSVSERELIRNLRDDAGDKTNYSPGSRESGSGVD